MTKYDWTRSGRAMLGVVLLLFASLPARAVVVTYTFIGTITGGDNLGETLAGSFAYDTATPGSGLYPVSEPFHFSIGSRTGLTAAVGDITIRDEVLSGSDRLALGGPLPPGGVFPTGFTLTIDLLDSSRTAFASNALPAILPPISAFDSNSFQIREFIAGIQIGNARGAITELTRVAGTTIAEPATLLLLTIGCAKLVWSRRRRQD